MIACKVKQHPDSREWYDFLPILYNHLNNRRQSVQIFKGWGGLYVFTIAEVALQFYPLVF